jgi:hypothetical protein
MPLIPQRHIIIEKNTTFRFEDVEGRSMTNMPSKGCASLAATLHPMAAQAAFRLRP